MRNAWIQTYTGKQFVFDNPLPNAISFLDIAHATSLQCRFNGHCRVFYSVAQHSLLVAEQVRLMLGDDNAYRFALLHDAAEAYIGDIVTPLKVMLPAVSAIEAKIMHAIYFKYGVDDAYDEVREWTKHFDLVLLATEVRDLMGPPPASWLPMPEPLEEHIVPMTAEEAEEAWLEAWSN